MKNKTKQQHLTWRESGHLFFVLHVFFFTKWSLIVTLLILFNPNLGIYGGTVSNFVCQLKMAVHGLLSLLAMEPVAQTGLWIWYWVQCDFKGNACRMFLLICHIRINCNTTVSASLAEQHMHIFKREEPCYGHQTCSLLDFLKLCIEYKPLNDNRKWGVQVGCNFKTKYFDFVSRKRKLLISFSGRYDTIDCEMIQFVFAILFIMLMISRLCLTRSPS